MEFKDKRVLVTGGSRGIGFGIAKAYIAEGAHVAINGKTDESVAAAIEKLGGGDNLFSAPGDIGTVAGCELTVKTAVEALGGLDILVNCAGVGHGRPIAECDEEMWDWHVDINLKGTFFTCRAAIPELKKSKGNILNIGSDAGLMGCPGIVVYCASKAGVVNMTKAMAIEIAPDNIRVNCICPGYVDTDMIRRDHMDLKDDPAAAEERMTNYAPIKRLGLPADIAEGVLYLTSDRASFVTGSSLSIDGGTTAGH